ncbi:hypothetical protein HJFPF1_04804 [Paramyrothecium foliicola]|nr:hypothetical protein HJFPF1_04804 [Paramyrothecium foliicola]
MTSSVKYHQVSPASLAATKSEDDDGELSPSGPWVVSKRKSTLAQALTFLGSLLLLALYTWAVLFYAREILYKPFCPRLTAPDTLHVWDEVRFNRQLVNPETPDENHPLLGTPSPEVDANWSALLSTFANRIPKSEVQRLKMEADAIPFYDEEGGYQGGLAVVHNLHCINYLYQVAHREYYYTPNTSEKEDASQKSHIGHCLHHIMESVKCQADLTPVLVHWNLHDYHSVINWNGVERTCADWSQLTDWGVNHSVRKSTSISQFTGNFLDEHGKFAHVDQEGKVDFEQFFKTPEYKEWASKQGIDTGRAAAEEYLKSFYERS